MAYVVLKSCIKSDNPDCVEVCRFECFYEGGEILCINPDECIDCGACAAACPVEAIVSDEEADARWLKKNAGFSFSEEARREPKNLVLRSPNCIPGHT